MNAYLEASNDGGLLAELRVRPTLIQRVKDSQKTDEKLKAKLEQINKGEAAEFKQGADGSLYFRKRLCVPDNDELKKEILQEAHNSLYSMHPGSNKNYQSSIQMAPYEALYGRKCRTPLCWTELNETKIVGPELIQETEDKVRLIRDRLKEASDRQKSYADLKRKDIEFSVGDKVFLKVSPWKKVLRFGKKGKLSPRFIGPYEILERVGPVAYRLALPPELEKIHNVFHVSMLRRYRSDPSHIIQAESVEIQPNLTYEEEPVQILAREIKELRNKKVPLVKILWRSHKVEEATWEPEDVMRQQYPYLFQSGTNFEDEIS